MSRLQPGSNDRPQDPDSLLWGLRLVGWRMEGLGHALHAETIPVLWMLP